MGSDLRPYVLEPLCSCALMSAPLCRKSPRGTADNQFLRILFSHPQKSLFAPLIENRCFKLFKKLILGYTLEDFIVGTRKQ